MARSANPLDRTTIEVAAQLPQSRLQAPATNAALQLADALKDASPEARALMQGVAQDEAEKQRAQAKQDALKAQAVPLADAVRAGTIDATRNPWYIQAYNREASAIHSQDALQKLQVESSSWDSYNDPDKFAAEWHEKVGQLAGGYEGKDAQAGFQASEGMVTSQVLQENVARNIARIKTERIQNLGALTADALQTAYRSSGYNLTPNGAAAAIQGAASQWFATGGSEGDWHNILVKSITSLAYATQDSSLLDLLKAPELLHGPSQAGEQPPAAYTSAVPQPLQAVNPDTAFAQAPATATPPPANAVGPRVRVEAPPVRLASSPVSGGTVTSGFGQRSRPKAGASTNHKGIDIAVPVGTPVKAQATGRVVSAGREGNLGNAVRIDYGNGVTGVYGHLSSFDVKPGDIVAPGQTVAASGRTGNVTGPHVHYQLMVNGKPTDPAKFRGNVGGSFEAVQAEAPSTPTYPGFPGQDAPFQAGGVTPGNVLNRGPSLYGMPGVADQVESDRYRINEAAAAAPLQRARVIKAQREAKGYEASDILWQKYGTGLMTGAVTRDQMIGDLAAKGYSGPEIAEAVNQVNSVLRDSVGVANAQVAARGQSPSTALDILDLTTEAQTSGYSPSLKARIEQHIVAGTLSGDDGERILGSALSRDRQEQSEARADAREDRAQKRFEESQGTDVSSAKGLRSASNNLAALVIQTVSRTNPGRAEKVRSPKGAKEIQDRITVAANAWLAANPGDFQGALQAAKDAANRAILELAPPAAPPNGFGLTGIPGGGSKSGGTIANPRRQ